MLEALSILENLLESAPNIDVLKSHRRPLSSTERSRVVQAGATWSDGKPGVWKAIVNGKTWYASNTHRCYAAKKSLAAACTAFKNIVEPSS